MMKRRFIPFVIFLISASIIGLLLVQVYYFRQSLHLKKQLFEQSVKESLREVSRKLEKEEMIHSIGQREKVILSSDKKKSKGIVHSEFKIIKGASTEKDSLHLNFFSDDKDVRIIPAPKKIIAITIDSRKGFQISKRMISDSVKTEKKLSGKDKKNADDDEQIYISHFFDSVEHSSKPTQLIENIAAEIRNMRVPLKERINQKALDSMLQAAFEKNGVPLHFNYRVKSTKSDSVIYTSAGEFSDPVYSVTLFPNDIFREQGILQVVFPGLHTYLYGILNHAVGLSIILVVILISAFAITLINLLRQKKLSQLKSDFINNMTHEFKTPLATISLASEAIEESIPSNDRERITKLLHIIQDENQRLGNHVEKILDSAKLEKDNLEFEKIAIDFHNLIRTTVQNMSLQVEKQEGKIELHLEAKDHIMLADATHLSGIIYNLVDNALKYCVQKPLITISTENKNKGIVLKISDNGIGISASEQKRIFEQFYRVPTGNIHNVKGFGLGLSYVRSVVKQMNGKIQLHSGIGKGVSVEIYFPIDEFQK